MVIDWKEVRAKKIPFRKDGTLYMTFDKHVIGATTSKGRKWLKENQSTTYSQQLKLVVDNEKKYSPLKTIDLTPTWSNVLPVLLTVLESGSREGKQTAKIELSRMAEIADKYVALKG